MNISNQDYWVVFTNQPQKNKNNPWSQRIIHKILGVILKKNFQHVFLLKENRDKNGWIIINPTWNQIQITEIKGQFFINQIHKRAKMKMCHIVKYKSRIKNYSYFNLISCVSICSQILGVVSYPTSTPYDLFKKISQ